MEAGRYARREDEQRYVAAAVPVGARSPRRVEDRYLDGTRLRLRLVTGEDGTVVRKLGHKVRDDPARPSAVWHTTCYLDDAEYGVLATLPAATLVKRRWTLEEGCADEFADGLEGLVLVEGPRPFRGPTGSVEVTDDERFCGGALAALGARGAASLVALARELVR